MTEIGFGRSILKDGRDNSVSENGVGYPECPYYSEVDCEVVDGNCTHPSFLGVDWDYCSLLNKPSNYKCPFDIHKELHGDPE